MAANDQKNTQNIDLIYWLNFLQVREHWIPFIEINPPKVSGQLDIELAISDQRRLKREKQRKMAIGKWKASRRAGIKKIDRGRIDQLESLIGKSVIRESESVSLRFDSLTRDHASIAKDNDSVIDDHDSKATSSDVNVNIIDSNGEKNSSSANDLSDSKSVRNDCEDPGSDGKRKNEFIKSVSSDSKKQAIDRSTTGKGKLTIQVRSSRSIEEEKQKKLAALKNHACFEKEELGTGEHQDLDCRKTDVGTPLGKAESIEAFQTEEELNDLREAEKLESPTSNSDKNAEVLTFTVDVKQERYYTEREAMLIPNLLVGVPPVPPRFPARLSEHIDNGYLFKELGLNVIIETIPKFQKNYPMYNFPCEVNLRRDQYCSHFKNVHDDIHGGLNSWIQHRCPLFQYGCSFVRHRLRPVSKEGCLVFDHDIDNFGVKPVKESKTNPTEEFSILDLPLELIERIAIYLDSFSMNQFSKTCKDIREVCQGLLQRRGIVLPVWERGSYADGSILWRVRRKVCNQIVLSDRWGRGWSCVCWSIEFFYSVCTTLMLTLLKVHN